MRLSKDSRGISEIVGAMMLILIVVIAAGSLAVFVSEQQESMQEKERLQQKIDNEEMQITSVIPHLNAADPTQWDYVNFTISNLNIENSEIVTIRINDHTLRTGDIWRYNHTLDKFEMETMSYQDHIEFESLEQASINITMDDFFEAGIQLYTDDQIKVELITGLLNVFEKTFIPPNPLIRIEFGTYFDGGGTMREYHILDGSGSWKSDDGYIVSWDWTIFDGVLSDNVAGIKANYVFAPGTYSITLKVTDNHGMTGTTSLEDVVFT